MILIQLLHFLCLLVFAWLAGYILYKDPKSLLNKSCAVLISTFSIWNFVDVFSPSIGVTEDTALLFQNISSFGWIGFASAVLYFSLVLSKKERLLKSNIFILIILILPLFFIYKQWTNCIIFDPVRQAFGWSFTYANTIWTYLFYTYYISFTLLAIYFIYQYGKKTNKLFEKKSAKVIIVAISISLIGGTLLDVIFPELGLYSIPPLANVFILVFAASLVYTIAKYKFLTITPAIAAENIISTMGELLIITNNERKILNINIAVLDALKYEQNELTGKSIEILFSQENLKNSLLETIYHGEIIKNCEGEFLSKELKKIPVIFSSSPLKDNEGDIIGMVLIARDITERKLADDKLRKSQTMYQAIFESTGTATLIVEEDCTILMANNECSLLTGYSPSELIGQKWTKYVDPENLQIMIANHHARRKNPSIAPKKYEVKLFNKKNETRFSILDIEMIPGTKQSIVSILDITELKRAENELLRIKEKAEESDRLKSAFLANMSHEIRTPMNSILGFAELLTEPGLTGEKQQEYVRIIENGGKRMLNIINDIVDISKIESGQMGVFISETNVNEQMEFIYTFFKPEAEQKGVQLFFKNTLPAIRAIIKTDKEKVYAILTNLVKNAIKFTYQGSIELGYNLKANSEISKILELEFFIKDTGIGISKEQQEVIFERFRQGSELYNNKGAGLGLSISKAYVEMLGGKMWVKSEPGKGSTFYFTLPYNAEEKENNIIENTVSEDKNEKIHKNLKILIAEDDIASEKLISIVAEKFGKEVLIARTGVETVQMCRNNTDIDLILMDVQMPEMNGYEAARQIRQFNKRVIIIAQTAFALSGENEKAISAGCNDYISKPINIDNLSELIQNRLNHIISRQEP